MDSTIEESFVRTFVGQGIQDRIIFELSSANRRHAALSRFAHTAGKYLKERYVYLQCAKAGIDYIENAINRLAGNLTECYAIVGNDGGVMPLRSALQNSFDSPGVSLIIANDNLAFLKTERWRGLPMKFILYKTDRI
jgi:hypothetical protein